MDPKVKGHARSNSSSVSSNSDVFEPISSNNAKHRAPLVEWLNSILPDLSLPINASDEELRAFLIDGSILCQLLNKLKPGSPPQLSDVSRQNVEKFLLAMDEMGLPRFQVEDLEKGSMKIVLESLLTLQTHIMLRDNESNPRWKSEGNSAESTPKKKPFRVLSSPPFGEERRKLAFASKSQRGLRSPKSPASVTSNSGHKLHEVFQLKQGSYTDLPAAKISEMMKSNSLDNAPTQSLLSVINGILDESVEMKNGEIPHRVAGLLRKVVQEIERRICTQAEHLRTQNNLFKAREEKYQSRIRVLEALATGTSEETQIVMNQLQQIKSEKNKIEEKKKVEDHDTVKLMKEKDELNQEIENLKQELERARRLSEEASSEIKVTNDKDELIRDIANLKQELKRSKRLSEEASSEIKVTNDKGELIQERANLKQELERSRRLSEEESLKIKVSNDKDELIQEIANLKRELERARRASEEESLKVKVSNDKDEVIQEMANLKLELERARRASEEESLKSNGKDIVIQEIANLKQELERARRSSEEESLKIQVKNDKDEVIQEIANLKQELERARRSNEEESLKVKVTKDKDEVIQEIGNLRQELKEKEVLNEEIMNLRQELKEKEGLNQEIVNLRKEVKEKEGLNQVIVNLRQELKEKDGLNQEITNLKKELEIARKSIEEVSTKTKGIKDQDMENLRQKVKDNDELKQEIAHLKKELEIAGRSSTDQESSKMIHMKERDDLNQEIAKLRQEVREKDKLNQERDELKEEIVNLRQEIKEKDKLNQEIENMRHEVKEEKDKLNQEITNLKDVVSEKDKLYQEREKLREELEKVRGLHEEETSKAVGAQRELENRLKETASSLKESQSKVKELDALFESKTEWWNKKQQIYHIFTEFQLGALRELRFSSQSIQQEVVRTQKSNSEEFSDLRSRIRILGDAAKNYYPLLAENRKMHNELQELKGNIRVYCRIRPFLPGQKGRQSIIEHVGEDGELVVVNPSKPGKEGRRSFKFDKVYSPTAKQVDVYTDTQPLVQSVLDGYNVCIFAYGQTGSGKTYTMTGPDGASEEEWGVNYRALSDLFRISQSRGSIFKYEVSVQMVEIYNEQVRDLLSSDGPKKLGILSASQPSGLAVPDACIQPVNSTADVLKLMDIGLQNRAKSSTAMNERSSRSHSIVSIHTRGQDLKSGSSLRGSLHLVDLAGSERVDRSEVTGDRLKEAQHINKSLSALGDVIFALAQKSAHVPYRNSKLTQVLQSSLGGRAKTLMFVQLNPDAISFSETISTLKFAERVSGVELGAAKSSKDGKDVRELMEQVASLKDTIAKKDEEIEELHTAKDPKNGVAGDKRSTTSSRYSGEAEDSAQTTLLVKQGKLTTLLNLDRHLEFHEGPCQDQLGSVPGGLKWSDCLRKPIYQPSP